MDYNFDIKIPVIPNKGLHLYNLAKLLKKRYESKKNPFDLELYLHIISLHNSMGSHNVGQIFLFLDYKAKNIFEYYRRYFPTTFKLKNIDHLNNKYNWPFLEVVKKIQNTTKDKFYEKVITILRWCSRQYGMGPVFYQGIKWESDIYHYEYVTPEDDTKSN